jgi:hypothetical protein
MKRKILEVDKNATFFLKSILYIKQCCDESSNENCVIITHELFKNSKIVDRI